MKELFEAALEARSRSYSPYSGCKVGAAVLGESGKVYTGANIENSSYGLSTCAEQVAIAKAVTDGEESIRGIAVVTDADPPWPPCGICRQMISEFAAPDTPIHIAGLKGIVRTLKFSELYPDAFTPEQLRHGTQKGAPSGRR